MNESLRPYTFSLMVVYFQRNDRLVSKYKDRIRLQMYTFSRKIVFFPENDRMILVLGSYALHVTLTRI